MTFFSKVSFCFDCLQYGVIIIEINIVHQNKIKQLQQIGYLMKKCPDHTYFTKPKEYIYNYKCHFTVLSKKCIII